MAHLWYSAEQNAHLAEGNRQWLPSPNNRRVYGRLNDGRVVEYTESLNREGRPTSNFSDFVYLGKGEFDHAGDIL